MSLGLGFQFRGSSLNLLVIFPLIPSTMSSAFFSNAVPKACAATDDGVQFLCEKNLRVSSGLAGLLKKPGTKKVFFGKLVLE